VQGLDLALTTSHLSNFRIGKQNTKRATLPSMFRLLSLKLKRERRERNNSSPRASQSKLSPSILLKQIFEKLRGPRSGLLSPLPSIESCSPIETSPPSIETVVTVSSQQPQPQLNVLTFLITLCPEDALPKILAFAGPQKTAALSKVSRVWRDVINEDRTWRVICEDLYKVCSHFHCFI
jgi:hypothetical protein